MTNEFTKKNWIPTSGDFMIVVQLAMPFEDKPITQVYFYPDKVDNPLAILTEVKQISYSELGNLITIISPKPFDGYVVIK
ncbi:hypothetical protein [Chryseobacterium schmidteae]|uniref:hypothetical protein n=1 Tax=Chryseobacterium schmidteae TaxID=2730404 RepID=UPI00158E0E98|nr:hypothetical protein [Chryseobacterium schmidteae]